MENSWEYRHSELIEKNRKILNEKLNNEIRQTGNKIFGLFYDKLNNLKLWDTKTFLENLKKENAKPTRIKRREFHYKHLSSIQQTLLKILKQFFDEKFIEIASDPQIWWLYFNQDLKDIVRFDFIFWYAPHNHITWDDVESYISKFFLQWWHKQTSKSTKEKQKSEPKYRIRLPQWHKLFNQENRTDYLETLFSAAQASINQYCQRFDIDTQDPIKYKKFIQSYFIYILKDSLFETKLILDIKNSKDLDILKTYIQDLINYLQQKIWENLDLNPSIILKKFFKNTDSQEISPLEFIYSNTSIEDISKWQEYFDQTYFSKQQTSCKVIYGHIMEEFATQWDLIKASHAFLSPDYFILKDKEKKLKSDLYVLNNCQSGDLSLQNVIDATSEELSSVMTDLDKHFYSKIDKDKKRWKWDSMQKITQKYMKYYKVPLQYRRNFFIIVNYLNHYHGIKSNISQKTKQHNQNLEDLLMSSPDDTMIMFFINEYITSKHMQQNIEKKWSQNYEIKLDRLKKDLESSCFPKAINSNKNHPDKKDNQLSLDL